MSIINEIKRIKESTQKAYESAENKGATIPEIKNIDNLSVCIDSIQGGGSEPTPPEPEDIDDTVVCKTINLSNCTSISDNLFKSSQTLEYIGSLESLTSLGLYAFKDCYQLKKGVNIPLITEYSNSSYQTYPPFAWCPSIQSITLGSVGHAVKSTNLTNLVTGDISLKEVNIYTEQGNSLVSDLRTFDRCKIFNKDLTFNYYDAESGELINSINFENSYGFTDVEYVDLSGHIINTFVRPSSELKFDMDFKATNTGGRWQALFGGRIDHRNDTFHNAWAFHIVANGNINNKCTGFNNQFYGNISTINSTYLDVKTKLVYDKEQAVLTNLETNTTSDTINVTNSKDVFESDIHTQIKFGGINNEWQNNNEKNDGMGNVVDDRSNLKIYNCKIYKKDILIRDFIPKQDKDGNCCLYDKVNERYHYIV